MILIPGEIFESMVLDPREIFERMFQFLGEIFRSEDRGIGGRGYSSDVDEWNAVRWHELASCGAWYDEMV